VKIVIIDNDSEVQGEIDLVGYNLDKSFARASVIGEIVNIVDGREDD